VPVGWSDDKRLDVLGHVTGTSIMALMPDRLARHESAGERL